MRTAQGDNQPKQTSLRHASPANGTLTQGPQAGSQRGGRWGRDAWLSISLTVPPAPARAFSDSIQLGNQVGSSPENSQYCPWLSPLHPLETRGAHTRVGRVCWVSLATLRACTWTSGQRQLPKWDPRAHTRLSTLSKDLGSLVSHRLKKLRMLF